MTNKLEGKRNAGIVVSKRPNLTNGQKFLYKTICEKLKTNDKLLFTEAKKLYINFGCRDVRNGIPYFWNWWWRNDKDEMVGRSEPMGESQINIAVVMWLTHNIGSLVLKGYLKVLPVLELRN